MSFLPDEALYPPGYSEDDNRDYAEERYWKHYCGACDSSPCSDPTNHEEDE